VPLHLSTNQIVEKNRLESTVAWTWLFRVDIAGAAGAMRYAMYDQPITFHGEVYDPAGIEVDSQEDATHAALVQMRVNFQNVNQEIIALFENYWIYTEAPRWTVRHWQIAVNIPDEMPFGAANVYSVQQTATDLINASAELILEGFTLMTVLPKHRYVATNNFLYIPRR
jgi:hypothetical protein